MNEIIVPCIFSSSGVRANFLSPYFVHSALEPAWSKSVHKDSGELFYLEAGKPVLSPRETNKGSTTPKDTTPGKTNRKGIAQLQKVLKVSKSRDSTPQSSPNGSRFFSRTPPGSNHKLRRSSPGSQSNGGTPVKEVILKVGTSPPGSPKDTLSIRLQGWLGIVPGKGATDLLSGSVMGNGREHKNGGPVRVDDRLMVRGLLPQGAAMKSAEIEIGKFSASIIT